MLTRIAKAIIHFFVSGAPGIKQKPLELKKENLDLSKLTKGDLYKLLKEGKISADKIKP
jgi:hypothetical protein